MAKYLFSIRNDRIKIGETPLAWHAKCSLLVAVGVSKTRVLKLRAVTLLVNAIKSIFTSS